MIRRKGSVSTSPEETVIASGETLAALSMKAPKGEEEANEKGILPCYLSTNQQ
jgi:hypothetical protein